MKENAKDKKKITSESSIDEVVHDTDEITENGALIDTSIQQQFNELKVQYLNERSNSMNRMLMFIGIVLLFFTILIPVVTGIAAYFVYQKYSDLQSQILIQVNETKKHATDAEKSADDAKEYINEIREYETRIKEIISKLTSKDFNNPKRIEILQTSLSDILKIPSLTAEDRAIIDAYRLQNEGKHVKAIEKWQTIANSDKGANNELVARAFFSIGYLHAEMNENDQAISAYDQAIELSTNFAEAFNSRGYLKSVLENHNDAILDYDEAIRLQPDFAESFYNRGNAKRVLKKYNEAIVDYDEVIRLMPEFVGAYNFRGVSKNALGQHQDAIADYDEAIRLKPDYIDAYVNRGSAKRAIGMPGEAKKDFDKAQELSKEQGEEKLEVD